MSNSDDLQVQDEDGQFFEEIQKIVDGIIHDMRAKKEQGKIVSIVDGHNCLHDSVFGSAYTVEIPLIAVAIRAGLPKVHDNGGYLSRILREVRSLMYTLAEDQLEADPFYKQVYAEEVAKGEESRDQLLLDLIKLSHTEPIKVKNFLKKRMAGHYDYANVERFLQNPNEEEEDDEETSDNKNEHEEDTNAES